MASPGRLRRLLPRSQACGRFDVTAGSRRRRRARPIARADDWVACCGPRLVATASGFGPATRWIHGEEALVVTYSIVARDGVTGDLGVAVQSRFLSVGSVVPRDDGVRHDQCLLSVNPAACPAEAARSGDEPRNAACDTIIRQNDQKCTW